MLVGIMQSLGKLGRQSGRLPERRPANLERLGQRHAGNEVADNERNALEFIRIEDRHDGPVMKLRGTASFFHEARHVVVAGNGSEAQQLDRDVTLQLRVIRPVNRAERTGADSLDQHVPVDPVRPRPRAPRHGHRVLKADVGMARGTLHLVDRHEVDQLDSQCRNSDNEA